jgi:hypothetical protein
MATLQCRVETTNPWGGCFVIGVRMTRANAPEMRLVGADSVGGLVGRSRPISHHE